MKSTLLLAGCLLAAGAARQEARAQAAATNSNVIMYIGDGFGLAPKTAARMAMGQGSTGKRFDTDAGFQVLALDKLKYNATVTTHSLNSWVTDSAPGASVYACGKNGKQDNEVISLNPATGASVETILEAAKKQGYAVGLVSTARITHATPAAFASHIWYRDLEDYIAAQYIASTQAEYQAIYNSSPTPAFRYTAARDWELPAPKVNVELDVILGGGSRHFLPRNVASPAYENIVDRAGAPILTAAGTPATLGRGRRADDVNLVDYAVTQRNYGYVNSRDALLNLPLAQYGPGGKKLLGLFNASHVNFEQDRQTSAPWEPTLAEMTRVAIQVLQAKSAGKGFFLIVESGRIDHLEHANTGGVSVVANPASGGTGNVYTVEADRPAYVGGGEANYVALPTTARTTNVYASDYMIKEVMAFDYAIAEGRALMAVPANGRTLMMTSSDHECGGFTLTGLHDEADAQQNGSKIRTYSGQVGKSVPAEAGFATPTNLTRGDGGTYGWFPDYTLYSFQGVNYPAPTQANGTKRMVVAYGSNPLTNGNTTRAANGTAGNQGTTPGNHTPQDVWVGADDNTNTRDFAGFISGRGLLDNTALTPIMARFLTLTDFGIALGVRGGGTTKADAQLQLSPVPFDGQFKVGFTLPTAGLVTVELFDQMGRRVQTVVTDKNFPIGTHAVAVNGSQLAAGFYVAAVTINGQVVSKKTIKL